MYIEINNKELFPSNLWDSFGKLYHFNEGFIAFGKDARFFIFDSHHFNFTIIALEKK